MRRSGTLGLVGALIVAGCRVLGPGPLEPVPGQPEAGTADDCAAACAHLASLNCPEGATTLGPDGKPGTGDESTCEQTCADVESSGYTTLNSRCVAKIRTCGEIDGCGWSAE